ncbi:MAG: zinc-binding alcohol dehydrogenase family protein [Betaproteobacteria bacterium]|nr:zinc-binding alcohol dehydrogenase family protein [Betaproteobacteria bacterium]
MKAVALTRPLPIADPQSLVDVELPKPSPKGRDLLVKVEAVSVNPVDTKRRMAEKTDAAPKVIGWDAAGTVAAVGEQVSLFSVGDDVYYAGDVGRPGSNSEFQLVDERIVGRKPKTLDFVKAAAMPLTSITAWEAFFDRMKIDRGGKDGGKRLLVIGGAGGVGSIGIQLARLAGLTVVATASRNDTVQWVKGLGAQHVINHREPLKPQAEALGFKDFDYIANFSGDLDSYWPAMSELIAPQGYAVAIVGNTKPMSLDAFRMKSASFCWEFMFTRPRFQTADMIEQHRLLNQVADWLDAGKLKCTLTEAMSPINAANLRKAHAKLESGTMIGKLVLSGWA